jgi:hypothetical protein
LTHFRVTELVLPATVSEAIGIAIDLDPPQGRVDNYFGAKWALLGEGGAPWLSSWALALADHPWIVEIGRCASNSHARVTLRDDAEVVGADLYRLVGPNPTPAVGRAEGSAVSARDGTGAIPLSLPFEIVESPPALGWVNVLALGVDFEEDGDMVAGRIAFAVPRPEGEMALREPFSRAFNALIDADPGCPGACDSSLAQQTLGLFDEDMNGQISLSELEVEAFRAVYVAPDVDLLATVDDELVYWPARDGRSDHVSMALGIVAERIAVDP